MSRELGTDRMAGLVGGINILRAKVKFPIHLFTLEACLEFTFVTALLSIHHVIGIDFYDKKEKKKKREN